MSPKHKPLAWLVDTITTPPFGKSCRIEVGFLLRQLQAGIALSMPESRPMPSVGARCHELRIEDLESRKSWRLVYRVDSDAIVIGGWFSKTTPKTPKSILETCKMRFRAYDAAAKGR